MLDILIRNTLIYDGSGGKPFRGSVGIADGKIASLGAEAGPAREIVDGDGLAVMPGIIDAHTHYDAQLTWDPYADPSPAAGVTTVVIGNCGFTIAPCRPADRELTMRNLTEVEGMSLDALRAGIKWDFETFPEFLDMLAKRGVVPNVAAYLGHSSIRTQVLGADAPKRAATPEEIAQMADLVRDAMRAGALGFASSTNEPHNGADGIPMPSRLASDDEFRALIGAMGESGRGTFMMTKGSKTKIAFVEELAALSGRPMVVAAILHNDTNPDAVFNDMAAIRAAQERGHKVYGQVSCSPLTMDFTFEAAYMFGALAAWKPVLEANIEEKKRLYADPAFRQSVRDELAESRPANRLFTGQWHLLDVVEVADGKNERYEGRDVASLAKEAGVDPLDFLLDLALSENLKTRYNAKLLNVNEPAVEKLLQHQDSSISLSDAGAHLTFLCDADFGLHLMGHWSRDRGAMPLEEAIRKLTTVPADIYGLPGRGSLTVGGAADVLLFDPKTVGRGPRRRVHDLPSGASRLTITPTGVLGVWVNGVRIVDENGIIRGEQRPGVVMREFTNVAAAAR